MAKIPKKKEEKKSKQASKLASMMRNGHTCASRNLRESHLQELPVKSNGGVVVRDDVQKNGRASVAVGGLRVGDGLV